MYDLERMNSIMNDIERFFYDLGTIDLNATNLNVPEKIHGSSMLILGIINRSINLAEEILVKNELPMPSSYSEGFEAIGKAGLIDKNVCTNMKKLIKQRGLFAHHYYDLQPKKVLQLSKEVLDVKKFVEKVKELVRKSESSERKN